MDISLYDFKKEIYKKYILNQEGLPEKHHNNVMNLVCPQISTELVDILSFSDKFIEDFLHEYPEKKVHLTKLSDNISKISYILRELIIQSGSNEDNIPLDIENSILALPEIYFTNILEYLESLFDPSHNLH
tara:strand:- start:14895 stop:15287 length:393 start_codon:yes stop_codon:yes gene_type:complete